MLTQPALLQSHLLSPGNVTLMASFVCFWRFFFFLLAQGIQPLSLLVKCSTDVSPSPARTFKPSFVPYLLTFPFAKASLDCQRLRTGVLHGAEDGCAHQEEGTDGPRPECCQTG